MPRTMRPLGIPPAALIAFAAAVVAGSGCRGGDPPCARHLLLVTVDTLRPDHLGLYGYALPTSPRLDRFAEDAVVFDNAYATSTWTLPSVASLVTSLQPATHGAERTGSVLDDSYETLAERLAAAGFRTAAVVSHTFVARRHGFAQGFAHFDDSLAAGPPGHTELAVSSPQVTARGLAWLDTLRGDDGRWFLWLHYFDPHHVYREHEGLTERFGRVDLEGTRVPESPDPAAIERWIEAHRTSALTLYDGEIAFTDRSLGHLFDGLAARGLADDTLVVFASDHGEEFLEHGAIQHRWNLHEETLRVPLLVRAPGVAPRRVETRVSLVDVAPTVLDLLCVGAPQGVDGTSLVPALRGRPLDHAPLIAELQSLDRDEHDAIVAGGWKLLRTRRGGETLLYDLDADPTEQHDLAAEHPERVRELAARLDARLADARRRAGRFGRAPEIRFSARELHQLRALGYAESASAAGARSEPEGSEVGKASAAGARSEPEGSEVGKASAAGARSEPPSER